MTEQEFLNAYLMGRHDVLRDIGHRLWDVEYYELEPEPLELEIAQAQYKHYKKNPKMHIYLIK